MKIGRNDPCPCGSGKKYKKCCLGKPIQTSSNIDTTSVEESNFKSIESNVKKLKKIVSQYVIEDIVRAVFCINAWLENRSALAQSLALNMAICESKIFGNKHIEEYSDLEEFYRQISPILKITPLEDLTLNDFGEVYINYSDEIFPIILGTGHEQVYAAMRFMTILADNIKRGEELYTVLCYTRNIINSLKETNVSGNEIVFKLPTEDFWNATKNMFDTDEFQKNCKQVSSIMGDQKGSIETRHFVLNNNKLYPLYNSSILVDYYKKLLSFATKKECREHIDQTLLKLIVNTYNFSIDKEQILILPHVIDTSTEKPVSTNPYLFATMNNDRLLIALSKDRFADEIALKNELALIKQLHEKNRLHILGNIYRDKSCEVLGTDVDKEIEIVFMLIEPFTDITSTYSIYNKTDGLFTCTALDALYFLGFADNIGELIDFIKYDNNKTFNVVTIGGKSNLFFTWKNKDHYIESGAKKYNEVYLPYGATADYIYSYFSNTLLKFPQVKHKLFSDPLNWFAKQSESGYLHIEHKGCLGFGGKVKRLGNKSYIFLAHNVEFFSKDDFTQRNRTALEIVDDLNQKLFFRYSHYFENIKSLNGKVLQILYLPKHHAEKIDHSGFLKDSEKKYVYCDGYIDKDSIIIRFTVNSDTLLKAIEEAPDRRIESEYFIELLQPLYKNFTDEFSPLIKKVSEDSNLRKTVGVFTTDQDYYYSDVPFDSNIEDIHFVKVRKAIAKSCLEAGVIPGRYKGRDATKIIREIQLLAVKTFEKQISKYNKEDLNLKILRYYAVQQHGVIINMKRFKSFKNLDRKVQKEYEEKTRKIREECRRYVRTAQYLLESNLAINHENNSTICDKDNFKSLMAFSDWLVVLQHNADNCYYTDFDFTIDVDSEYKVNPILEEPANKKYEEMFLRKYNIDDYSIKFDKIDKGFVSECMVAFYNDTGVDLNLLFDLIQHLQFAIVNEKIAKEVCTNVFEVSKDDLIQSFKKTLPKNQNNNSEQIENALDFIILDETKLKMLENAQHDILPVWDREKRKDRFDVKPIIIHDNKCLFSPVVMKKLGMSWINGISQWYLPYEVGLTSVIAVIDRWKKRYEDAMVKDIAEMFSNSGFDFVEPEIDFSKRFPKDNYPEGLGDYDIIAIHKGRREIWLIESKVLQKVGSVYEDQMQQKSFFFQHKDNEKFQRRIDYFGANKNRILNSLKISDTNYSIIPYMVTNKLFDSRYKEIKFKIITYSELKELLAHY
jgi:hypothetical protein